MLRVRKWIITLELRDDLTVKGALVEAQKEGFSRTIEQVIPEDVWERADWPDLFVAAIVDGLPRQLTLGGERERPTVPTDLDQRRRRRR